MKGRAKMNTAAARTTHMTNWWTRLRDRCTPLFVGTCARGGGVEAAGTFRGPRAILLPRDDVVKTAVHGRCDASN